MPRRMVAYLALRKGFVCQGTDHSVRIAGAVVDMPISLLMAAPRGFACLECCIVLSPRGTVFVGTVPALSAD